MRYGVCAGTKEMTASAARAGFDYVEWTVGNGLRMSEDDSNFSVWLQEFSALPLSCLAMNCLVPGHLPILGAEADEKALHAYLETVFARAARARVQTLVFGSGKARNIPDSVSPREGRRKLLDFCRLLASFGERSQVTVVLEPLNRKECNVMNSVRECAEMVRQVDHPNLRLLADSYHMAQDGDRLEELLEFAPLLGHAHVATGENRLAPTQEPCPVLEQFMRNLSRSGYQGSVSVEGRLGDDEQILSAAENWLKQWG